MPLKKKLIFGAIGLVVLIMITSLSFVSILVTKQNKLTADALQMASANKMASKIAYLNDNKREKNIHLLHAQYQTKVSLKFNPIKGLLIDVLYI